MLNLPPTGHGVMADAYGNLTPKVLGRLDARYAATEAPLAAPAPSWASASAHSWSRIDACYNPESPMTERFRRRVREALDGKATRLTWVGDSKTYGIWRDAVPYYVQDWAGAKPGMIYAATQDRRWTVQAGYAGAAGQYQYLEPDAGATHTATMVTDRPHTGFTLYAAAVAGGTATVTVDGAPQTWTIPSGSAWKTLTVDGLANANHTVVINSTDPVLILGADMRFTTTGLKISNAARNGATAAGWNLTEWNGLWNGAIAPGAADLIIAGLGTNNETNFAALDAFYDKLVALGVPVIMTAPGGLASTDTARAAAVQYLYDIADRLDLPLLDFRAVIGTDEYAAPLGLKRDLLHENERGFVLEAQAVSRFIGTA